MIAQRRRRVVITGLGVVSSLGIGGRESKLWENLLLGKSGIVNISDVDRPIWKGNAKDCPISAVGWISRSVLDTCRISNQTEFIEYALLATKLALEDGQLLEEDAATKEPKLIQALNHERCGTAIGNGGIGSLKEILSANQNLEKSLRKLSPFFVPRTLINMAAGHVSIKFDLKGPNHSVATACAAGTHSIGDAFNFIRLGMADLMIAGNSVYFSMGL